MDGTQGDQERAHPSAKEVFQEALNQVGQIATAFGCIGVTGDILISTQSRAEGTTGVLVKATHDLFITQYFYRDRHLGPEDVQGMWAEYDQEGFTSLDVLTYIHSSLDAVFGQAARCIPIRLREDPSQVSPGDALHAFMCAFMVAVNLEDVEGYQKNTTKVSEANTSGVECPGAKRGRNQDRTASPSTFTLCIGEIRTIDKLIHQCKNEVQAIGYELAQNNNKLPLELLTAIAQQDTDTVERVTFYPNNKDRRYINIVCSFVETVVAPIPRIGFQMYPVVSCSRKNNESGVRKSHKWDVIQTSSLSTLANKRKELMGKLDKILNEKNMIFWESKKQ